MILPEWMERAKCIGVNPDWFFPETGSDKTNERLYELARDVCKRCCVQQDCLDYAQAESINYGMWGGQTPSERDTRTKKWGKRPGPIAHGTYGGYRMHRRRGEEACEVCLVAYRAYRKLHANPALKRCAALNGRCHQWAMKGSDFCYNHGGKLGQTGT